MAKFKPTKDQLTCRIKDIAPDSKHPNRMLVSVEFDDGDKKGPWCQPFSLLPEKIISMDDFLNLLMQQPIERPVDPYKNLKLAMQSGKQFVLEINPQAEQNRAAE